jgi:hypothetical protein
VLVGPEARQTTIETIEIGKLIELVFDGRRSRYAIGDKNELLVPGDDRHRELCSLPNPGAPYILERAIATSLCLDPDDSFHHGAGDSRFGHH